MTTNDRLAAESFIPDLCQPRAVITIIVVAEILALILCLGPGRSLVDFPVHFAVTSLFVQWVALVSAALLCNLRGYLSRIGNLRGGFLAFLLLQIVTLVFSYLAVLLLTPAYIPPDDHWALLGRNLLLSALISAVLLRLFFLQHQIWQNIRRENLAYIGSLQARIRPHFLFNSLNTVASLVVSRPLVAEEAVLNLADLFRASLAEGNLLVSLGVEVDLCQKYLHIEQQRLGPRLTVLWNLEAIPMSVTLPPLVLQPLLENAIYHGLETLPEGGTIKIDGYLADDMVTIKVVNPVAAGQDQASQTGNQMALENVRQRLAGHYGQLGKLETLRTEQEYVVMLIFPKRNPTDEDPDRR